ncbi:class I SAM-dependent methyltransferase [Sphingomonas solaris]|uniref:Class I SAM-dependent methyltransferase n=1 Tax=Alterirhizorhabdus solaris TaxID=2529389 RepID=A0A558R5C4_9SPHN|nr:class I SAM-dependent methyltransferase [Sphingomonas solaris]TVV74584.1 class I SAM-dependent methyltransferase [Sphingomonas solaris]
MINAAAARVERERAFHNDRFTEETREAQGKFYAAIKHGSTVYEDRVKRHAIGKDILEYGSGALNQAALLAPVAGSVMGIDISDVAIAAARAAIPAGHANLRYEVMDAENLTLPDRSLDLIFGRGIIHHLDLCRSFETVARVLRPDGKAIFWEPLGHNLLLNLYRRATPNARTLDEHPLLKPDIELARSYFEDVRVTFYGLTTLASVPIRDTAIGDVLLNACALVDRALFVLPGVRWQAWYCLLELGRPKALN